MQVSFAVADVELKSLHDAFADCRTEQITYSFFDTNDFCLLKRGWWLVLQYDRWELRVWTRVAASSERTIVHEIRDYFRIMDMISEACGKQGDRPEDVCPLRFAQFETTRYTYRYSNYCLQLDETEFAPEDYYAIATLKVWTDPDQREKDILHDLPTVQVIEPVRSKVCEYLYRYNTDVYKIVAGSDPAEESLLDGCNDVCHSTQRRLPLPDYQRALELARERFFEEHPGLFVRDDDPNEVVGL